MHLDRSANPVGPARRRGLILALVGLVCAVAGRSPAQSVDQTFALRPGWNAVFLEVIPANADCPSLFAGLPVESVWDWNRSAESAQFVQDPETLIPGDPGWLTWFPANHPLSSHSTLFSLRDGRAYLIKLAEGVVATSWTVTGRPSLRPLQWQAGGLNFVGFRVAAQGGPTFATLFAGEAGLVGQPVYRLGSGGAWEIVQDLTATGPIAGEAYWVRCRTPSTWSGTLRVDPGSREGIVFGNDVAEQGLRIRNSSPTSRRVSIRVRPADPPPVGEASSTGVVPLETYSAEGAPAVFDWRPLGNELTLPSLAPGAEWNVPLAVRRASLNATAGGSFQSLLEVFDDMGTRWLVPVRVETPLAASLFAATEIHAGLWVGEAVIRAVSQPAHPGDPVATRPAGGEFQFRLILHVDAAGSTRLLQHVFVVRKPAIVRPDPERPGFQVVDEPARTVVLTDESLIPGIVGSPATVGRRISSAAFGFKEPVVLEGGGFGSGTLTRRLVLDYRHPLNPFQHIYHPDHDNLDERFEQALPEGQEAFTVERELSLEFTATDPMGLNPPGWGDTEFGGAYHETIRGLHRDPIQLGGTFRLVRVASASALNE